MNQPTSDDSDDAFSLSLLSLGPSSSPPVLSKKGRGWKKSRLNRARERARARPVSA